MADKNKTPVEIGVHMPDWLPRSAHFPVRVVMGTIIGLLIAFYCVAMSFAIKRIWIGLEMGAPQDEIAFDLAYLAVMVGAAYVVRHVLKRGRARPVAEM